MIIFRSLIDRVMIILLLCIIGAFAFGLGILAELPLLFNFVGGLLAEGVLVFFSPILFIGSAIEAYCDNKVISTKPKKYSVSTYCRISKWAHKIMMATMYACIIFACTFVYYFIFIL